MSKETKNPQPNSLLGEEADSLLNVEPRLPETLSAWLHGLRTTLADYEFKGRTEHVGRIVHVADGVTRIQGLPFARFNELLRFPGDVYGLVFNLDPEEIGCVLLGDDTDLSAGDPVRLTGEVVVVPVGEALLGRVVDALGRPLDGEGSIKHERRDPIEAEAPRILDRRPVVQQLITGSKAVDALIPIGRGQRELIVGDRAVGKTALAVDAMLSQKDSGVINIYVAIGQKVSTVKRVAESLQNNGVMGQSIVVSADADDAPGLQYIVPYAATTMGEYFMKKGRDVLVIYDDLTRHARAYREISLLLRRPPGREAYPGDIFFIHSRLLERATRLVESAGGGSLTAIPIVETQAKNMSAYIPTNLISITDGQVFLDPDLFYKGVKPAIHIGKSVSRVGGKTQLPAIRTVAKQLRLDYAQFAELEIFTRFGATVEEATRKKIERGRRIREVLKQPRLDPLTAGEEVLILLSVDRGIVDAIAIEKLARFQQTLRDVIPPKQSELLKKIDGGEDLEEGEWDALVKDIEQVAEEFIEVEEPRKEVVEQPEPREKEAPADAKEEPEGGPPEKEAEPPSEKSPDVKEAPAAEAEQPAPRKHPEERPAAETPEKKPQPAPKASPDANAGGEIEDLTEDV
jgi:F-type H+-transporting ATPase subunit alpha